MFNNANNNIINSRCSAAAHLSLFYYRFFSWTWNKYVMECGRVVKSKLPHRRVFSHSRATKCLFLFSTLVNLWLCPSDTYCSGAFKTNICVTSTFNLLKCSSVLFSSGDLSWKVWFTTTGGSSIMASDDGECVPSALLFSQYQLNRIMSLSAS